MRIFAGTVLGFVLCLPGFVFGVGGPNCVSLYFDESAEVSCMEGVAPQELFTMYIVLTNPTIDLVYGFEFGFDIEGEAVVIAIGIDDPLVDPPFNSTNLIIPFSTPHPTTSATVLAWVNLFYQDASSGPVEFFAHGTTPSSFDPAYPTLLAANGELIPCNNLTDGSAVAVLNGDCNVVSTKAMSFDGLKSLFR